MTSPRRFPDLTGKAVVAVGDTAQLVEVTRQLAANRMLIAVVARDRALVRRAVETAEELDAMVNGFTADPADPAVWERIRPHIEQRLGPIDVVICAGDPGARATVVAALVPDMKARRRGVLIEIGTGSADPLGDGVRHHLIEGDLDAHDVAATAVGYATDQSL